MARAALALVLVSPLVLASPSLAFAQSSPDPQRIAAAQTLYDAAVADLARGDPAAACPKLEEVVAIEPAGLGARFALASCYERAGRLASAWVTYKLIEAQAARQNQLERRDHAAAAGQALAPRLARLTLEVPAEVRAVADLAVVRDGAKVGAAQWGEALPVDAGAHVVEATAPGRVAWSRTVRIDDGAAITLRLELPAAVAPQPPAPSGRAKVAPSAAPSALKSPANAGFWDAPRGVGVAAGAFGVVALAAGAVSFGTAIDKKRASEPYCSADGRCKVEGFATRVEAVSAGNLATALAVAGGASVAAGALLLFAWPRATTVALSPLGARVEVRF